MSTEQRAGARWPGLAAIVATALLLAACAQWADAGALGFVALVPWLLALDRLHGLRAVLLSATWMSVAYVAAVFGWFGAAIGAYTGVGASMAIAVLLLLAPLMQAQVLAFALVRHWVGRERPLLRAMAGAAAWVACEAFVPKLLGDTLGHALHASTTLRQAAELGGAAGLTVMLLLVNEALALAAQRHREGLRRWVLPTGIAVALVIVPAAFGQWRLAALAAPPEDGAATLRIAMVQASITDYERRRREDGEYAVVRHVLDTHYALSMSAIREHGADALLWSETVYPTTFGHPRSADGAALDREIQGFVDIAGVPLVFGTYDVDTLGEYNAAVVLEPGRGTLGTYRKTHPFPLTEHVPARLDGPALRRLLPWAGAWRAGDGARVLPLRHRDGREVQVLPLICLDDVHPQLALDGARLGAQAIVGLSNDSWFTDKPVGARLHLAVAAFRSVETRLPQLRVTTNGLSAVIDERGEVLARTEMGQQAVLTGFVSARDPAPTLMVRWGDWVGRAGAVFLLGLGLWSAWRRGRTRMPVIAVTPQAFEIALLPPVARGLAALLRLGAALGLAWLAFDMATRVGWQVASLAQLTVYASVVLLPLLAARVIAQAFEARASIEGASLVLDGRRERIEIPLAAIARVEPWMLPLPASGADLVLGSGRRWSIAIARPEALRRRLLAAGATLAPEAPPASTLARFAEHRALARRPRLDHPLLKFALFPLLPALVAFRLHQVIAFGGVFGEWLSYGAAAWFTGLAIWWGAWSLGLMLFAAALRISVEAANVAVSIVSPGASPACRDASEWLARLAFYVGAPAGLVLRIVFG